MEELKIGMSVVYQQGEGDAPLSPFGRKHAALVGFVGAGGVAHLVIFPMGRETRWASNVEKGSPASVDRCWYFPHEG